MTKLERQKQALKVEQQIKNCEDKHHWLGWVGLGGQGCNGGCPFYFHGVLALTHSKKVLFAFHYLIRKKFNWNFAFYLLATLPFKKFIQMSAIIKYSIFAPTPKIGQSPNMREFKHTDAAYA